MSLILHHRSSGISYPAEENPFRVLFADVTHRCDMECRNCYLPNREIPDMDVSWLYQVLARLPRRTRIRLSGGEPTVRKDLPDIIRTIRRLGHNPILLTNGLKLAKPGYAESLKQAGLRTLHLSMNGGLLNAHYQAIDNSPCAERKLAALEAACRNNFFVTVGMIVARGINDEHVSAFYRFIRGFKPVREFHLRNIGSLGRYMPNAKLSLDELIRIAAQATHISSDTLRAQQKPGTHYIDFKLDGLQIQLTDWPDLGNRYRGRITPSGTVEPYFEHALANEGGY